MSAHDVMVSVKAVGLNFAYQNVKSALSGAAELTTAALSPRLSWLSVALAPPEEPQSWLASLDLVLEWP